MSASPTVLHRWLERAVHTFTSIHKHKPKLPAASLGCGPRLRHSTIGGAPRVPSLAKLCDTLKPMHLALVHVSHSLRDERGQHGTHTAGQQSRRGAGEWSVPWSRARGMLACCAGYMTFAICDLTSSATGCARARNSRSAYCTTGIAPVSAHGENDESWREKSESLRQNARESCSRAT